MFETWKSGNGTLTKPNYVASSDQSVCFVNLSFVAQVDSEYGNLSVMVSMVAGIVSIVFLSLLRSNSTKGSQRKYRAPWYLIIQFN